MTAYGLDRDQVVGPGWMGDTMNKGFAVSATLPPSSSKEEYCGMLRNLLASRFHLTFRIEQQSRAGYKLTLLPGGPKFKRYDANAPLPEAVPGTRVDANGFTVLPPSQPTGGSVSVGPTGLTKETLRQDMAYIVRSLEDNINQSNGLGYTAPLPRVVDKTGLQGVYDIRLEFAGTPSWNLQEPAGEGPNIFNAVQQQLGLKLTKVKDVPVDVLIIDHADQTPTEN